MNSGKLEMELRPNTAAREIELFRAAGEHMEKGEDECLKNCFTHGKNK